MWNPKISAVLALPQVFFCKFKTGNESFSFSASLWTKEMQMLIRLMMKRRNTEAKCWEVKVIWWPLRPHAGDSTLPLSCIYPLAAVRRVGFVDRGGWGGNYRGPLREWKTKMSETEREMYRILMSDQSRAEWRTADPCLCTHLYPGWKAAIFSYFTLHLSLMSSRCSPQQLHTRLGEQKGAFPHIRAVLQSLTEAVVCRLPLV